jgi:hypothetical protein
MMAVTDVRLEPRSKAAATLARLRALKARLTVHMPFVWRTRLLLYVVIAVMASALIARNTRAMDLTRDAAMPLSAMELMTSLWIFLTMGFVALCCFDVARRTGAVFVAGHRVRLGLCVAASVVAIQLPQVLLFRSVITSQARLETEPDIDRLLKRHGSHGFWRCLPENYKVPEELVADLRTDLRRYGLDTNLEFQKVTSWRYCRDRSDFQANHRRPAWSLVVWPLTPVELSERESRLPPIDYANLFEGQLRSIKAAHQSMRGEGPYAAAMDIRRPLAIAALASILTTLFVSAPLARSRALTNRGRFMVPLRGRLRVPYDEWIARRWPPLWFSRVAVAPLSLLSVPLVFNWIATNENQSTTLLQSVVFVFAVLITLGTQRDARYVPGTASQETVALGLHAVVLLAMFILAHAIFNRGLENFWSANTGFVVAVAGTIYVCGGLQAARVGSIYTAFGAIALAYTTLTATVPLNDKGIPLIVAFVLTLAASLVVVALYAWKLPVRPTAQRTLLGALFVYAALFWTTLILDRSMLPIAHISENQLAAAVLPCSLFSFAVILRIIENRRRLLADATN